MKKPLSSIILKTNRNRILYLYFKRQYTEVQGAFEERRKNELTAGKYDIIRKSIRKQQRSRKMGKTLVIAEKPSVGRDIARVLKCTKNGNGTLEEISIL